MKVLLAPARQDKVMPAHPRALAVNEVGSDVAIYLPDGDPMTEPEWGKYVAAYKPAAPPRDPMLVADEQLEAALIAAGTGVTSTTEVAKIRQALLDYVRARKAARGTG